MQPRATSSFNVVYAHAYYYHSDERLKKNIEPLEPDLVNRLYDLKGVEFDWKESGDHDIGLIAQEVKKVFPELVAENAEGTMGVKYGNLVALLLEAAKEQKKTIDELSQTVGTQTEFINNLKAALPPMMLMSTEERKAYQAQQAALAASQQPAQPQPEPVPPAPPVEAAPISETGPSLVALPPVNLDDVPLADDIKICPSVEAPACLSKEKLSHAEEFSCRTDTTSYMYSARIAYLCVRADKNAEATLRQQFADAMEKATQKGFDLGDDALESVAVSHVIAFEGILSGASAVPVMTPDENAVASAENLESIIKTAPLSSVGGPEIEGAPVAEGKGTLQQIPAPSGQAALPAWAILFMLFNGFITLVLVISNVRRKS